MPLRARLTGASSTEFGDDVSARDSVTRFAMKSILSPGVVLVATLSLVLFASGCVSPPFVTKGVNRDITPADILEAETSGDASGEAATDIAPQAVREASSSSSADAAPATATPLETAAETAVETAIETVEAEADSAAKTATTSAAAGDEEPSGSDTPDTRVLWGGVVVGSANTDSSTEIEVLSYPLDYLQRPDVSLASTGRFLLRVDGYLETADLPPGSRVSAVGTPAGSEEGQIGDAEYRYAVLKLAKTEDLHRWTASEYYNSSRVGIGIGISISN